MKQAVTLGAISALGLIEGVIVVPKLYKCNDDTGFCELQPQGSHSGDPQNICLLTCKGTIWPAPNDVDIKHQTSSFCDVKIEWLSDTPEKMEAVHSFMNSIFLRKPECSPDDNYLEITFKITEDNLLHYSHSLDLSTDESYTLDIEATSYGAHATISASSFYGSRHGLETLSQLIADNNGETFVASDVHIFDKPSYPYRGVMLDLSRNYLSVSKIKDIIRGMGYNKLNRLHLHLTDTASFPLAMKSEPNMAMYGSYGEDMQYDAEILSELTSYAKGYGVALVPEIDTPSHVNEGWQWGALENKGNFTICTTDWTVTALEPPAGHLNIANENVYPVLKSVYEFVISSFKFPDLFHIGGDEVVVGSDDTYAACWNSSTYGTAILDKLVELGMSRDDQESFYYLWHTFTHRAADMITSYYQRFKRNNKLIIWGGNVEPETGTPVTYNMVARPDVVEELPPSDYIMEIWDDSANSIAPDLLSKGYEVILANYDYVYLDCGQPGFTNPGGYWCNPYHEWYHIYQYMADMQEKWNLSRDPSLDSDNSGGRIIGSEILLWAEENGDQTLQTKIWPRGAALAEALWSNPQAGWYAADPRMQLWRNKLVSRGISAAELQPLWCAQNGPYSCTIDQGQPE